MRKLKAISTMIATIILIAIVLVGGTLVYVVFSGFMKNISHNLIVNVESAQLYVNRNNTNPYLVLTLKNGGSITITNMTVKAGNLTYVLDKTVEPGQTTIVNVDARNGWIDTFIPSMPTAVVLNATDGESTFSTVFTVITQQVGETPTPFSITFDLAGFGTAFKYDDTPLFTLDGQPIYSGNFTLIGNPESGNWEYSTSTTIGTHEYDASFALWQGADDAYYFVDYAHANIPPGSFTVSGSLLIAMPVAAVPTTGSIQFILSDFGTTFADPNSVIFYLDDTPITASQFTFTAHTPPTPNVWNTPAFVIEAGTHTLSTRNGKFPLQWLGIDGHLYEHGAQVSGPEPDTPFTLDVSQFIQIWFEVQQC